MAWREEGKGTSVPQLEGTAVLLAGVGSLTTLGATERAPRQRAMTEPLRSAARVGGAPGGPHRARGTKAGQERCVQLPVTTGAKAFVRALPVCGRGSPLVPLLRQDELGQQSRGNGLYQPRVPTRWASLLSRKPSER